MPIESTRRYLTINNLKNKKYEKDSIFNGNDDTGDGICARSRKFRWLYVEL